MRDPTYTYCREVLPASTVDRAVSLSFTRPGASNLALARGNVLELYKVKLVMNKEASQDSQVPTNDYLYRSSNAEEFDLPMVQDEDQQRKSRGGFAQTKRPRLHLVGRWSLHGKIMDMQPVRNGKGRMRVDRLLLSFAEAKMSLLSFDQSTQSIVTESIHYYEHESLTKKCFNDYQTCDLRTDPEGRCVAMRIYEDQFAVLPLIAPSELGVLGKTKLYADSFVVDMRSSDVDVRNIRDFVFLAGYLEPTLAILHEQKATWPGMVDTSRDTGQVTVVSLDMSRQAISVLNTASRLPSDCQRLLALPESIGGVLVFASSSVSHVVNGTISCISIFNKAALRGIGARMSDAIDRTNEGLGLVLDPLSSACIFVSSNTIALWSQHGDVFLLRVDGDGRLVKRIVIKRIVGVDPRKAAPPPLAHTWDDISLLPSCAVEIRLSNLDEENGRDQSSNELINGMGDRDYENGDDFDSSLDSSLFFLGGTCGRSVLLGVETAFDCNGNMTHSASASSDDQSPKTGRQNEKSSAAFDDLSELDADIYGDESLTPSARSTAKASYAATPNPASGNGLIPDRDRDSSNTEVGWASSFKFTVYDEILGTGSIVGMAVGAQNSMSSISKSADSDCFELVTCGGNEWRGCLRVQQRHIQPEVIASLDLPGAPVRNVWTARCFKEYNIGGIMQVADSGSLADLRDTFMILSRDNSTSVFAAGNELQELSGTGFYVDGPTIEIGELMNNTRVVQVYASGLRLVNAAGVETQSVLFNSASEAISAEIADPYVLVRMAEGSFIMYEVSTDSGTLCETAISESIKGTNVISISLFEDQHGLLVSNKGYVERNKDQLKEQLRLSSDQGSYDLDGDFDSLYAETVASRKRKPVGRSINSAANSVFNHRSKRRRHGAGADASSGSINAAAISGRDRRKNNGRANANSNSNDDEDVDADEDDDDFDALYNEVQVNDTAFYSSDNDDDKDDDENSSNLDPASLLTTNKRNKDRHSTPLDASTDTQGVRGDSPMYALMAMTNGDFAIFRLPSFERVWTTSRFGNLMDTLVACEPSASDSYDGNNEHRSSDDDDNHDDEEDGGNRGSSNGQGNRAGKGSEFQKAGGGAAAAAHAAASRTTSSKSTIASAGEEDSSNQYGSSIDQSFRIDQFRLVQLGGDDISTLHLVAITTSGEIAVYRAFEHCSKEYISQRMASDAAGDSISSLVPATNAKAGSAASSSSNPSDNDGDSLLALRFARMQHDVLAYEPDYERQVRNVQQRQQRAFDAWCKLSEERAAEREQASTEARERARAKSQREEAIVDWGDSDEGESQKEDENEDESEQLATAGPEKIGSIQDDIYADDATDEQEQAQEQEQEQKLTPEQVAEAEGVAAGLFAPVASEDETAISEPLNPLTRARKLTVLENVGGYAAVFVSGLRPVLVLVGNKRFARVHPVRIDARLPAWARDSAETLTTPWRPICAVARFHSDACAHGLVALTQAGTLVIGALAAPASPSARGGFEYDSAWPTRTLPVGTLHKGIATLGGIVFHRPSGSWVVAAATTDKFYIKEPNRDVAARQAREDTGTGDDLVLINAHARRDVLTTSVAPLQPRAHVDLLSPATWETVDTYELERNEHIVTMRTLSLESAQSVGGRRDFVCVGTSFVLGEDVTTRGAVYVFDVVDVVPLPGRPQTNRRLKLLCREELRGTISALGEIRGNLVMSVDSKVYVRSLQRTEQLVSVAFLNCQSWVRSLVGFNGLLLVADISSGLWLAAFQEEGPTRVQVLSRDATSSMSVDHADFLVLGRRMQLLAADSLGALHLFSYAPYDAHSAGGQHLLRRGGFNLRSPVTAVSRLVAVAGSEPQHVCLAATASGAVCAVSMLPEKTFKRLHRITTRLVHSTVPLAGLNPREYRSVPSHRRQYHAPRPTVLDGDLLAPLYAHGPISRQRDAAQRDGTSADRVLRDIVEAERSFAFF
ncbi:mRNA cleavage and polyadenylation factor subunit [Coemansia erecta]|nr:mRNA cleavage and polyadenylation factor subunit [Coemansia erecta]